MNSTISLISIQQFRRLSRFSRALYRKKPKRVRRISHTTSHSRQTEDAAAGLLSAAYALCRRLVARNRTRAIISGCCRQRCSEPIRKSLRAINASLWVASPYTIRAADSYGSGSGSLPQMVRPSVRTFVEVLVTNSLIFRFPFRSGIVSVSGSAMPSKRQKTRLSL